MNSIEVTALDSRLRRFEDTLANIAARVFKYLKLKDHTLEIYIVNASKMKALNTKYRGKKKATDVVAVEDPGFPGKGEFLGEIYLCPSVLEEKPYTIEYALIHGILHLLGFNHDKGSDKIKMESKEKEILEWLDHTS